MEDDEIQGQIEQLRQHVRMGVVHFTLGPAMVATLIDESDGLAELHRFKEAYGVHNVLGFFGTDEQRARALLTLLGAEESPDGRFMVRFDDYIGCFWRRQGAWAWYPQSLDGLPIEAPKPLVQMLSDAR